MVPDDRPPDRPVSGDLDSVAVVEALEVLDDVPDWRMSGTRWSDIAPIIEAMVRAVAERDSAALVAATAELEVASPLRYTGLDSAPRVPPPPQIHTLHSHLVHALGGTHEEPMRGWVPVARVDAATDGLLTQYLVVHVFAAMTGPAAAENYRRIQRMWAACGAVFGAVHPIDALNLPTGLPDAPPTGVAIAAGRSGTAEIQAIVRRKDDALVLSIAAKRPDTTWAHWASRWDEVVTMSGDDGTLMSIVTIFAGTVVRPPEATPATAQAVAGALPPTPDEFWQADGTALADCVVWQLPPPGDGRRRRLLVLADAAHEAALSALVWSRGGTDPTLTPLTQYLLNAAEAYYERRVRDAAALVLTARRDAEPWLDGLSDAVESIRDNMVRALRAAGLRDEPTAGPFAADLAAAETLRRQIALDRRHVRRSPSRAVTTGAGVAVPTVGLVTVLPEEYAAMRALLDDPVDRPVAEDLAGYVRGFLPSADPARPHEVVLTMLTESGTDAAAHGEANLVRSFPSVSQLVVAGIAAGVPAPHDPANHVRLGDIVAGTWSLIDFDHIVDRPTGPERRQEFPRRSALLAGRVKLLAAGEMRGERPWENLLDRLVCQLPDFARPDDRTDVLFSDDSDFAEPVPHPDPEYSGHRPGRPKVHEGRIGSSDRSVRNAASRDAIARRYNLRAIEMEGKGIGRASHADGRDWFVVRGISDYGDRWLDTTWRRYAAATAAAYVAALLAACPPLDPRGTPTGGTGGG